MLSVNLYDASVSKYDSQTTKLNIDIDSSMSDLNSLGPGRFEQNFR